MGAVIRYVLSVHKSAQDEIKIMHYSPCRKVDNSRRYPVELGYV